MERRRLSEGQEVTVMPTGTRLPRLRRGSRAIVIDLLPEPRHTDRVRVRYARGGTATVRIHRLRNP